MNEVNYKSFFGWTDKDILFDFSLEKWVIFT